MIDTQNARLVGYARVSTNDQELALQIDAIRAHGVTRENLFCDKLSGAREDRPGLVVCLSSLERGDTLVVWRLDRLGRSMRHLVNMIEDLKDRGIGFRSIADGMIDTTSASGELVLNIFSALVQFERRLIQERTNAGLAAARARGRKGGRPAVSRDSAKVILANKLYCDKSVCLDDICTTLKTINRNWHQNGRKNPRFIGHSAPSNQIPKLPLVTCFTSNARSQSPKVRRSVAPVRVSKLRVWGRLVQVTGVLNLAN